MTITAQIIADSISPDGIRLTTMQLRYPRFIHAEFMTHRVFSRNASSSRAIPVTKMIEDLRRDPAMPVYWGSNKPGMQAGEELSDDDTDPQWRGLSAKEGAKALWATAMENSIASVEELIKLGLHKQIANRILEPWAHINVVVTATDWANFFALRRHPDAQPEIKALADTMHLAMDYSKPTLLNPGNWHLPYIQAKDYEALSIHPKTLWQDEPDSIEILRKVSVARCARVSYLTHDGRQTSIEEDLALYERLVGSQPQHASPAEHQATPDIKTEPQDDCYLCEEWKRPELHGNFRGWVQYRKTLSGENISD